MDPDRPANDTTINAWVQRHQYAAWRYVRLLGCPPDVADDLLQDALMAAVHKNIHQEPEPRGRAWLQQAVRNLWLMHCRSEGRRVRNVDAALVDRALQQCTAHNGQHDDGEVFRDALRRCLEQLEGRSRLLLERHYASGASRDDIAREFGMRNNGVKALLRRVRGILRDCVLRQIPTEPEQRL